MLTVVGGEEVRASSGSNVPGQNGAMRVLVVEDEKKLGERGPGWLDERGIGGRFVSLCGEIVENGCWSRAVPACI